jgi:hypothetical protein
MKRILKENSKITPAMVSHFKKHFDSISDDDLTSFLIEAERVISETDKDYCKEYQDFYKEDYYIDTTRSSDWSPSERPARREEIEEIIESEHGTEEAYVRTMWEDIDVIELIKKEAPDSIPQSMTTDEEQLWEFGSELYELFAENIPIEKLWSYNK